MSVNDIIDSLIEQREEADMYASETKIMFSIRLRERDHNTLVNVARYFDMKKTPMAELLLTQAVDEAARKVSRHLSGDDEEKFWNIYYSFGNELSVSTIEDVAEGA